MISLIIIVCAERDIVYDKKLARLLKKERHTQDASAKKKEKERKFD